MYRCRYCGSGEPSHECPISSMEAIARIDELLKEVDANCALAANNARMVEWLRRDVVVLTGAVYAIENLIVQSESVSGLHANGDNAPWSDLRRGGRFEDWLLAFDEALDLVCEREKENATP